MSEAGGLPGRRGLAVAAALGLLAALLYSPSLGSGLVWDDREYVLADGGRHLAGAMHGDLIGGANPAHGAVGYYRPVAVATFWVAQLLPAPAAAHHAASALLHGATAALLFLLLVARLGSAASLPAALAVLAWSAHPASVEAVAWISARYDLLTGLFAVLLLLVPGGAGWRSAALSGLAFLGGVLSKESFAALAAVLLADDWGARRRPREAAPRWIAVGGAILAWIGLRVAFGVPSPRPAPISDLPGHAFAVLSAYMARAIFPWPLTVSHPYPPAGGIGLAAASATTGLLVALLALPLRRRDLAPAVALFLAPLLPAAMAAGRLGEAPDRYLYLPSLGLAWLLAAGLSAVRARSGALFAGAAAACIAATALGTVLVLRRLPDWRSDEALFTAAYRVDPANPVGAPFLAIAAVRAGRTDEAVALLQRSQRANPLAGRVASTLAWVQLLRGDGPAALEQGRRAVALLPGSPEARVYLANAWHLADDHAAELDQATRALRLSPAYPQARIVRALSRCEVEQVPACEADLDGLLREGVATGADARVLGVEAALSRRDPATASERLEKLRTVYPADPRIPVLDRALQRMGGSP